MSTNSQLILKLNNDKYKHIYCHFDGGVNNVGYLLFKYYNTYDKVFELFIDGNILSLSDDIKSTKYYSQFNIDKFEDKIEDISNYISIRPFAYNYLFDNNIWYVLDEKMEKTPLENYFINEARQLKITAILKNKNEKY